MKGEVLEENTPYIEIEEKEEEQETSETPSPFLKEKVISAQNAFIMTHLLQGVVQHGTGQRAKVLGRPIAGKTGTSSDYADAWFIGYTPSLLTGVWVGFDDKTSLGINETGARAALPIWISFMDQALKSTPIETLKPPMGIKLVKVNIETGLPSDGDSPKTITEAFIDNTIPWEKEAKLALRQSGTVRHSTPSERAPRGGPSHFVLGARTTSLWSSRRGGQPQTTTGECSSQRNNAVSYSSAAGAHPAMTVIFFIHTPRDPLSAVYRHVEERACALQQRGHSAVIVVPEDLRGNRKQGARSTLLWFALAVARFLVHLHRKPDLVIFHSYAGWVFNLIRHVARTKVKTVTQFHGLEPLAYKAARELSQRTGMRLGARYRAFHGSVMPLLLRLSCRFSDFVLLRFLASSSPLCVIIQHNRKGDIAASIQGYREGIF